MTGPKILFGGLLMLVTTNTILCNVVHRVVDSIALHDLGQHAHNVGLSAADAASEAYSSFKNYANNLGLEEPLSILNPNLSQLFLDDPSAVEGAPVEEVPVVPGDVIAEPLVKRKR